MGYRLRQAHARCLILVALCVLGAGFASRSSPLTHASEPSTRSALVDSLDRCVRHVLEMSGVPGLSIAVTNRDSLLLIRHFGFADMKLQVPVTDRTLFQIGSISKSFTAIALLQLVEDNRLALDEPIVSYLPWFSVNSDYGPITAHHLLTHSAGIPANRDDIPGSPYMAYALREQMTAWPPGERFLYSNIGYQVLHALVERVSGRPYDEVIQDRILDPLGMAQSRPVITLASRSEQAVGYIRPFDDRVPHRSQGLVEAPHFAYGIGDGSIQSTASEMAKYVRMLLREGEGPRGRLISEDSYRLLAARHVQESSERNDVHYGYGLGIEGEDDSTVVSHSGGMVGFTAWIALDPEAELGVVVLTNGPVPLSGLTGYALSLFRSGLKNAKLPAVALPLLPMELSKPEDFGGIFTGMSGDTLRFLAGASEVGLMVDHEPIPLEPLGPDSFYCAHPEYSRYAFAFTRDDSGHIDGVTHGPRSLRAQGAPSRSMDQAPARWQSYVGKYRSYSPWLSYFEVYERDGALIAFVGREIPLTELTPGSFRIDNEPSPERLVFTEIVDGKALRAEWSGHPFFRVFE